MLNYERVYEANEQIIRNINTYKSKYFSELNMMWSTINEFLDGFIDKEELNEKLNIKHKDLYLYFIDNNKALENIVSNLISINCNIENIYVLYLNDIIRRASYNIELNSYFICTMPSERQHITMKFLNKYIDNVTLTQMGMNNFIFDTNNLDEQVKLLFSYIDILEKLEHINRCYSRIEDMVLYIKCNTSNR